MSNQLESSSTGLEAGLGDADVDLFERGLSEVLDMMGISRGTRSHTAIQKMMTDDLLWYFENLRSGDLEA